MGGGLPDAVNEAPADPCPVLGCGSLAIVHAAGHDRGDTVRPGRIKGAAPLKADGPVPLRTQLIS